MVSREEFLRLLAAYAGAIWHTAWAANAEMLDASVKAQKAEDEAREAIVKAVFP